MESRHGIADTEFHQAIVAILILTAIQARDSAAARRAMQDHLNHACEIQCALEQEIDPQFTR